MKIAVVTVYDGLNFGSFLQAYAMQAYLKEQGHQVYFVQRMTEEENLALFTTRKPEEDCGFVRRIWRTCLKYTVNRKRIQRENRYYRSQFPYYQEAWKQFRLRRPGELSDIDCLVCGSDEIWNLNNLNLDVPFYACAGYGSGKAKLAAAVSAGNAERESFGKYPQLEEAIRGCNEILVRDKHTGEIIKEITGRAPELVCDPTLMVDRAIFRKHESLKLPGNYMLVYTYGLTEAQSRLLKEFAGKHGYRIVSACMDIDIADEAVSASPLDFAGLVAGAECCVTTTFHGTIFSLLFAKRFCTVAKYPKISALIEEVGAQAHLWDGESAEELEKMLETEADREALDGKLEELKSRSADRVNRALKRVEERSGRAPASE